MKRLLQLDFLPCRVDCGLLALRLWFGISLFLIHGWGKLSNFSHMSAKFPDPLHISSPASLALATFAEAVCSLLIILGLFTRLSALVLIINMATAFIMIHQGALGGQHSGELAFLYLGAAVALLAGGGGKYSLDAKIGGSPRM